jgi:hypothetical protein
MTQPSMKILALAPYLNGADQPLIEFQKGRPILEDLPQESGVIAYILNRGMNLMSNSRSQLANGL